MSVVRGVILIIIDVVATWKILAGLLPKLSLSYESPLSQRPFYTVESAWPSTSKGVGKWSDFGSVAGWLANPTIVALVRQGWIILYRKHEDFESIVVVMGKTPMIRSDEKKYRVRWGQELRTRSTKMRDFDMMRRRMKSDERRSSKIRQHDSHDSDEWRQDWHDDDC